MSRRVDRPDTQADVDLRNCVSSVPPRSFVVKAGAGSGKTTSLVKGISEVIRIHGKRLRTARQQLACITYTEVAAGEVWRDVGNDPLVHVSTIHSFLWRLSKTFQSDIKSWVAARIARGVEELRGKQAAYGLRVQQRTKDKDSREIERLLGQIGRIERVASFRYGTGSDYAKGVLGHDDILKLAPQFISERPLFRALVARQFPFVFVDESQDTTAEVVEALRVIEREPGVEFCLGFFGDPMQRIYATGTGVIQVEPHWLEIPKPENFRCSSNVLKLANAIRRGGDDLSQVQGQRQGSEKGAARSEGSAHFFVLPADDSRDGNLARVRAWMAEHTGDNSWQPGDDDHERVRMLVVVHQMAARRLGFGELYAALNNKAPAAFKEGFLDGSFWAISPCQEFLIPVAIAYSEGRQLEVMRLLRKFSPLLERDALVGVDVAGRLRTLGNLVSEISNGIAGHSTTTIGELLRQVHAAGLLILDSRLVSYLDPVSAESGSKGGASRSVDEVGEVDESEREIAAMGAYLACPAKQLLAYHNYISQRSPFRTQQGIKGTEFERVLVVLDDAESTHTQFSYEKYLGLRALSAIDQGHLNEGEETTVDRTRRLFYVCCTRALTDLAVVLFTTVPEEAVAKVRTLQLFEDGAIHSQAELQAG